MVGGPLFEYFLGFWLLMACVHSECINDGDENLISLLLEMKAEMGEMKGKMQAQEDINKKQDNKITEMQENMDEKMQKVQDGMTKIREKMLFEQAELREKFQGEINKLNIERMEERYAQLDNRSSDTEDISLNNATSLALAVLELSATIENLQTCKGDNKNQSQTQMPDQMSRIIDSTSLSTGSYISNDTTTMEIINNGLSEFRKTIEDLQARVEDLATSRIDDDQHLAPRNAHRSYINIIKPRYCHDIYIQGERQDGVYDIYPGRNETESVSVWCEFDVGSEVGWTIILARMPTEDPVDFNLGWDDYKAGFGDAHNEYWIGLSLLHEIFLSHCSQVLHVTLQSWDHTSAHAQYKDFSIGDEDSGFKLSIGEYNGDAGDAMLNQNGMKFTTKDKDNDKYSSDNCADLGGIVRGGFWHNSCYHTNPFGVLLKKDGGTGMTWNKWISGANLKGLNFKISPRLPSLE